MNKFSGWWPNATLNAVGESVHGSVKPFDP